LGKAQIKVRPHHARGEARSGSSSFSLSPASTLNPFIRTGGRLGSSATRASPPPGLDPRLRGGRLSRGGPPAASRSLRRSFVPSPILLASKSCHRSEPRQNESLRQQCVPDVRRQRLKFRPNSSARVTVPDAGCGHGLYATKSNQQSGDGARARLMVSFLTDGSRYANS
jgi:hypothetical protein